tara:strand:+ start:1449 stop:1877 length:429 start_codon:yes stop_codon:yes gene_type:complete
MNDYSDVLYLTAAMVIYSLLTINTARSFLNTSETVIRSDVEYRTIIRAQDEIEQVKLISREDEDLLNPNHANYMFNSYPKTDVESFGYNDEYSDSYIINGSSEYIDEGDPLVKRYRVVITVTNESVDPSTEVDLIFIKSFER